jgi:hypothetical protein
MSRRLRWLLVCLPLALTAGVSWAVGYQPNFIRELVGPITITGDLTVTDDLAVTDELAVDGVVKTDSLQTFGGGATAMSVCTTGTGNCTFGNSTSTGPQCSGGSCTFAGIVQVNGALNSGAASACSWARTGGASAVADAASGSNCSMTITPSGTGDWNLGAGRIGLQSTDSTGSPGAATINKASGRSAVAAGAGAVTITNSKVAATSNIQVTPLTATTTDCADWYVSAVAAGSFTLTCPSGNVAAWSFMWVVFGAL